MDKKFYNQQDHGNDDGAVRNVEYRPALHNKIGEVHINKIRHLAKGNAIYQVSQRTTQDETVYNHLKPVACLLQQPSDQAQAKNGHDDKEDAVASGVKWRKTEGRAIVRDMRQAEGLAKSLLPDSKAISMRHIPADYDLGDLIQDQDQVQYPQRRCDAYWFRFLH